MYGLYGGGITGNVTSPVSVTSALSARLNAFLRSITSTFSRIRLTHYLFTNFSVDNLQANSFDFLYLIVLIFYRK